MRIIFNDSPDLENALHFVLLKGPLYKKLGLHVRGVQHLLRHHLRIEAAGMCR
jgi:hypothetical protein